MNDRKSPVAADGPRPPRRPRSDGRRNRESIVSAAREAFAAEGAGASLDDIAKKAGVGSGTLYRHFPSRAGLLEAVYRAEVERLAEAAARFGETLTPVEALRSWLRLFVDYLATKKIVAAALNGLVGGSQVFEDMSKVREAVDAVYGRAIEAGAIRADLDPLDHLRALLGITTVGTSEDWGESAARLVDILILGSRPP